MPEGYRLFQDDNIFFHRPCGLTNWFDVYKNDIIPMSTHLDSYALGSAYQHHYEKNPTNRVTLVRMVFVSPVQSLCQDSVELFRQVVLKQYLTKELYIGFCVNVSLFCFWN